MNTHEHMPLLNMESLLRIFPLAAVNIEDTLHQSYNNRYTHILSYIVLGQHHNWRINAKCLWLMVISSYKVNKNNLNPWYYKKYQYLCLCGYYGQIYKYKVYGKIML